MLTPVLLGFAALVGVCFGGGLLAAAGKDKTTALVAMCCLGCLIVGLFAGINL